MPSFTAEASLYKTREHYRLGGTFGILTGGGEILPRIFNCLGTDGTLLGSIGGNGGVIERCTCIKDASSSTGWRQRCCYTLPGAPSQATQCDPPGTGDECSPPGCGPCVCTCMPNCTRTCIRECWPPGGALGQPSNSHQACIPSGVST